MGIKTQYAERSCRRNRPLKNLPTTRGLRLFEDSTFGNVHSFSAPTTRGYRQGKKRPSENLFQTAFSCLSFIG